MRNLLRISEFLPQEIYNMIVSKKRNPYKDILFLHDDNLDATSCIQNRVMKRYEEYIVNSNELSVITEDEFSVHERNCLLNCYTSDSQAMRWLYNNVFDIQDIFNKDKCPYCGINSPSTRDHYLPKELFPEYSILSYNLIPCCGDCNSYKGSRWKDEITGRRLFINFYFDRIPSDIFLTANISINDGIPLVEINLTPPNEDEIYFIIRSHFKLLKVIERIEYQVNSYVFGIFNNNQSSLQQGLTRVDLKQNMVIDIGNIEKNHGVNYWKAVVSRGILECDYFFEL